MSYVEFCTKMSSHISYSVEVNCEPLCVNKITRRADALSAIVNDVVRYFFVSPKENSVIVRRRRTLE